MKSSYDGLRSFCARHADNKTRSLQCGFEPERSWASGKDRYTFDLIDGRNFGYM
jgi:hypothetical protein